MADDSSDKSNKKDIDEFKRELAGSNPQELLPEVEKKKTESIVKKTPTYVKKPEPTKDSKKELEKPKVYSPKSKKEKPKVKMSEKLSEEKVVKLLAVSIISIVIIGSLVGYITFKGYFSKKYLASNSDEVNIPTGYLRKDSEIKKLNFYNNQLGTVSFAYPDELELVEIDSSDLHPKPILLLTNDNANFMKISYYLNEDNQTLEDLDESFKELSVKPLPNLISPDNESVVISENISALLQKNYQCANDTTCHRYLIPVKGRVYEVLFYMYDKNYAKNTSPKILTSLTLPD